MTKPSRAELAQRILTNKRLVRIEVYKDYDLMETRILLVLDVPRVEFGDNDVVIRSCGNRILLVLGIETWDSSPSKGGEGMRLAYLEYDGIMWQIHNNPKKKKGSYLGTCRGLEMAKKWCKVAGYKPVTIKAPQERTQELT